MEVSEFLLRNLETFSFRRKILLFQFQETSRFKKLSVFFYEKEVTDTLVVKQLAFRGFFIHHILPHFPSRSYYPPSPRPPPFPKDFGGKHACMDPTQRSEARVSGQKKETAGDIRSVSWRIEQVEMMFSLYVYSTGAKSFPLKT